MRVITSAYLFDNEPVFYEPLGDVKVCEISNAFDANQIVVDTTEGTFLITLVRNGPSTVQPYNKSLHDDHKTVS